MGAEPLVYKLDETSVDFSDNRYGERAVLYPFEDMDVGKSFTVNRAKSTINYAITKYCRAGRAEREFRVRELPEGGCRVWRVK